MIQFDWFSGFSRAQKRRSVQSLHRAAEDMGRGPVLEVSSKGLKQIGKSLSAFNLTFKPQGLHTITTVEAAFQGSKVFANGGPFADLLQASPLDAKQDIRLRKAGALVGFRFLGIDFPIEPPTAFYDWLYINALRQQTEFAPTLDSYQAFTDIEFNPKRSVNCQAHSVALLVSMMRIGLDPQVSGDPVEFKRILSAYYASDSYTIVRKWARSHASSVGK